MTRGGFTVTADDPSVRRRFTADEIAAFLPPRGPFTFPEPYGTLAVRLTNPDDDPLEQVGYPYWWRINAHAAHDRELCVIMGRGAEPALLLVVDKRSRQVQRRPLPTLTGTGEQWYFSAHSPFDLCITEGARLLRYDVRRQTREVLLDLGHDLLWQCSSSDDDTVHAGTWRDGSTGETLGAVVLRLGEKILIPKRDVFDECQIDRSGRYLVIKEGADNRIIDLDTHTETTVADAGHALGHSDAGFGYAIGEDDYHAQPGAFVRMDLANPLGPSRLVYHMTDWSTMARHVSHTNAPQGRVLISAAHRADIPRANELVFAPLDGSLVCTVIAPTLIDLDAQPDLDDYKKLSMANLDARGEWACWWANCGTDRGDAFLVRCP